jgi:hypothetical protein
MLNKYFNYFIFMVILNINCYQDGKLSSPFEKEKETDESICVAIYLFCDEQFKQCASRNNSSESCVSPYQSCNNTVRECIQN